MIIEIRKAGFVNKGAELMLHAALQKLRTRYPDATFVMAPTPKKAEQPFRKLVQLGFYPKAWLWRYGIQWGTLANFAPRPLPEMYGVVLDKEVDVVIDAAGFAYSDQWGEDPCAELAQSTRRWKKNGTRVILLPQALVVKPASRFSKHPRVAMQAPSSTSTATKSLMPSPMSITSGINRLRLKQKKGQ